MGTTAQKLTHLNETKSQLKDTINYSGASITDDTFRQYPRKLYTQYLDILKNPDTLFNGMPKIEQTGIELSLNDTADTLMQLDLNPSELTQETTTGANLMKYNTRTYSYGGLSYSCDNNGQVVATGNNISSNVTLGYNLSSNKVTLTPGTYTLNAIGVYNNINFYKNSNVITMPNTFTLTQTTDILVEQSFSVSNSYNANYYITLARGTTATTERYTGGIPSPNPDYPSEVQVIKGNNSIKIENANIWDEQWENGYYNRTTGEKGNGDNYIRCKDYILITPNTSIYFSKPSEFVNYSMLFYDSNKNKIGSTSPTYTNSGTFTLPSNARYFTFYLDKGSGTATYNNNLMINLGTTPLPYVAHQEQVLPLNLPNGMEYCKIGTYEDEFEHDGDKWYLNKYIGKYTMLGTETFYNTSTRTNTFRFTYEITDKLPNNSTVSMFKCNRGNGVPDAYWSNDVVGICEVKNSTRAWIVFSLPINEVNSTSTAQTWFANNETIIYYVLTTPTHTEITDTTLINQLNAIEQAVSYDEQTNISQTNAELPFRIKATAVKNLESVFE